MLQLQEESKFPLGFLPLKVTKVTTLGLDGIGLLNIKNVLKWVKTA